MGENRPSLSKHSLFTGSHQNNSVLWHDEAVEHGRQPHKTPFRSEAGPWGRNKSAQAMGHIKSPTFFFLKRTCLFLKQGFCFRGIIEVLWQEQPSTVKKPLEKLPLWRSEILTLTVGYHCTQTPSFHSSEKKQIWRKMVHCLNLLAREHPPCISPLWPTHREVAASSCQFVTSVSLPLGSFYF